MDNELRKRIRAFLSAFELVFDHDWYYTKLSILDEYLISDEGTFINPFPGEHFTGGKGDNWANRSHLLAAYRELKAFAISEGIHNPDEEF